MRPIMRVSPLEGKPVKGPLWAARIAGDWRLA
jgi:hypothetical protein